MKIAKQHERHDAFVGDALGPPHPTGRFDFAISIAVLHHLSTRERRIDGVRTVLNTLRSSRRSAKEIDSIGEGRGPSEDKDDNGQALFFVWALEQKGSRRGWEEGGEQDVLVPWVLKPSSESSRQSQPANGAKKSGKKKMKEQAVEKAQQDGQAEMQTRLDLSAGSDDAATHPNHTVQQGTSAEDQVDQPSEVKPPQIYQRYYHLYHQGELEEDIVSAGGEVVKNGYDRDNWWCIAKRRFE